MKRVAATTRFGRWTDELRAKAFKHGVIAAAAVAGEFDGSTTHAYRLDDVISCKLNVTSRKKPRRNKKKLQHPEDAWEHGFAVALGEAFYAGASKYAIQAAARAQMLTLARAKAAGCEAFDLRRLRKAGVPK